MIDEKDVITIKKSEWDMIFSGEKWALFQNDISLSEEQKIENNDPATNPYIIYTGKYIYFKEHETGTILGQAIADETYFLLYDTENECDSELVYARNKAIKEIYFKWCEKKSLKPNPKEGWFKSKKFAAYLDKVGWSGNYALFLTHIVEYETKSVECPWCEREQKIYVQKQTLGRTSHKCESCGISFAIWQLLEGSDNK